MSRKPTPASTPDPEDPLIAEFRRLSEEAQSDAEAAKAMEDRAWRPELEGRAEPAQKARDTPADARNIEDDVADSADYAAKAAQASLRDEIQRLTTAVTAAIGETDPGASAVKQDSELHDINIPVILYRLSLVVVLSLSAIGIIVINGGGGLTFSTIIECMLALVGGASIRLLISPPDSLPRFDFSFLRSKPPTESSDSTTKPAESAARGLGNTPRHG
jgi:hypothetical protein